MARAKVAAKKVVKKTAPKTVSKKKAVKRKVKEKAPITEGSKYACELCGLAVTVDEACGCAEAVHLVCCEVPMKIKK